MIHVMCPAEDPEKRKITQGMPGVLYTRFQVLSLGPSREALQASSAQTGMRAGSERKPTIKKARKLTFTLRAEQIAIK